MAKDNKIKDKELNKVSGGYIPGHGYERYEYDENCPKCKGANKVHVIIMVQPGKKSTDKECTKCDYREVITEYSEI